MADTPSLKDFYALVDEVERRLLGSNELEWAGRLRLAVASGATGGEILDNVGVVARDLRATSIPDVIGSRAEVEHIYRLVAEWYAT